MNKASRIPSDVARKHRLAERMLGLLLLLLAYALPVSSASAAVALTDIGFSTLPGEKVQIVMTLSGPAPQPGSFTIDNPASIALDFPGTSLQLDERSQNIGVGAARSISAVEAGGRTRVVIKLARMVPYDTQVQGNTVIVTLAGEAGAGTVAPASIVPTGNAAPPGGTRAIQNIDFRRGEHGEGRVVITLTDPTIPVDMQKRGKQIILNIPNTQLPSELERRIDVIDFATPVTTVDAFNQGGSSRIVINAGGDFDHLAYQADNTFTVDVRPIIKAPDAQAGIPKQRKKKEYVGERLSLNFQNIEVRAVLQLIADFTGKNMVTSDTVTGSLTLRLKNVPWDQALDIILKTKGLDKRESGNVILVAPAEEIAAREKLELEAGKQIKALAPLESLSIQVNYAKAADLAALLKGGEGTTGVLSERGAATVDERTNRILLRDVAENLDAAVAMVEELDIPVRQVLIESRIVLAKNDFTDELGVDFGVATDGQVGNAGVGVAGNLTDARNIAQGGAPGNSLNVNLADPTAFGSFALSFARLPLGTLLDLELRAAQEEGRSETISSPRVITANQREGYIEQGTEIPYTTAASSGATTVQFKKAVLSLRVTPQITPDDRIIMDLIVTKDAPDFGQSVISGGPPPIDTQQVHTQVLVSNGQTVVLGGIYETTEDHRVKRVPFFGDLPIIGGLFRSTVDSTQKQELLIFITPKIISERVGI